MPSPTTKKGSLISGQESIVDGSVANSIFAHLPPD